MQLTAHPTGGSHDIQELFNPLGRTRILCPRSLRCAVGLDARSRQIGKPTATVAQPAAIEDDWLRVKTAGVIEVASPLDNQPFNMYNSYRKPDGFDVALMQDLAHRLGLQAQFVNIPFEGLLGALQLGQVDAAVAAMAVTR